MLLETDDIGFLGASFNLNIGFWKYKRSWTNISHEDPSISTLPCVLLALA